MLSGIKLPPIGRVRLSHPVPEENITPPSIPVRERKLLQTRDLERPTSHICHHYSDGNYANSQTPRNITTIPICYYSNLPLIPSSDLDNASEKRNTSTDLSSNSATRQVSFARRSEPLKQEFQFIQIYEASSKADTGAGSHLRSHLMRKYHENRRKRQQGWPKVLKPLRQNGCTQVEVVLKPHKHAHVAHPSFVDSTASERTGLDLQVAWSLPSGSHTPLENLQPTDRRTPPSYSTGDQSASIDLLATVQVVCAQCEKLMLHYLNNGGAQIRPLLETPQTLLASNSHDPFDSLPTSVNHHMHAMLHHFIFYHAVWTNPLIYTKDGFPDLVSLQQLPLALSDAACIHAIVAGSLFQQALLKLKRSSTLDFNTQEDINENINEASYHVMEAISLLNEKFENPKESLSVTSILSTALLGACATYNEAKGHLIAHHKGMLKMIELRGGIDTLPRGLAYQMSRVDANLAWQRKSEPPLPIQPNLISALQRELFKDTFAAVQHAIVLFPYPEDVGIKSAAYYCQHSWRVAALIYVNCALYTWYVTSPAIKAMVAELVAALRASDLNNFWHEFPEVLVWVLFIGVIGAWVKLDRGWILLELRHWIGLLGLTSLEELEELLKSLLYPECMLRESLRKIWGEINA